MPKFYLNLGYKLKKKALCYSHLNNTVDILDRNIVMDYFRHENHWQSSQKKKNNNKTIYYICESAVGFLIQKLKINKCK